jgi:hypothetical protein
MERVKEKKPRAAEKVEEKTEKAPALSEEQKEELRKAEYEKHMIERAEARKECGEKMQKLLTEYSCELTAQMLIGEHNAVPKVFIIDARPKQG